LNSSGIAPLNLSQNEAYIAKEINIISDIKKNDLLLKTDFLNTLLIEF